MRSRLIITLILIGMIFAFVTISGMCAQPINLTGTWECDNGGKYYIYQQNNKVWWYGESSPRKPEWTNVAFGYLRGREIKLEWAGVPKAPVGGSGYIILEIQSSQSLKLREKSGPISGTYWTKTDSE
jgi:hypothetical protein